MKRLFFVYILPLLLSLVIIYFLSINPIFNKQLFSNSNNFNQNIDSINFIESFNNNQIYEGLFLNKTLNQNTIYILGSSELTSDILALPNKFIPRNFTTKVIAVGHAGNQCFSIFTQLLANENKLNNSNIVIIISPGWFEAKPALGTTSKIFLEYNSEHFLNAIYKDSLNPFFVNYACKRIAQKYSEFNSPCLELKLLNYKYQSSLSFFHQLIYFPIVKLDNCLFNIKENILNKTDLTFNLKNNTLSKSINVNWDSLYQSSKEEKIKKSTNNNLGIDNDYYTEYINGRSGKIETVPIYYNQELEDFLMLIKLIKTKHVNAKFVITPLNPFYFKELKKLDPTINIIKNELKANKLTCLNLFESDTNKYEKPILHDVMHMSDYGWYKIDKFIVTSYNLSK